MEIETGRGVTSVSRISSAIATAFVACAATLTTPANATEVGLFAGPIGGSDARSAYLPPYPGLYLGGIVLANSYNDLRGPNGAVGEPHDSNLSAFVMAPFGLLEYPWKLFGGRLASSATDSYGFIWEEIAHRKSANSGGGDIYSDLITWSRHVSDFGIDPKNIGHGLPYGLSTSVSYSMVFPTGRYAVKEIATEGHHYFVLIPNFALTYLSDKALPGCNGTEISTRFFYDMPTKNSADDYQSGNVFDIDWGVTERVGHVQVGIAGDYARQTTPDMQYNKSVAPDGNILARATIGPVLIWDLPKLRGSFKAKVLYDYFDEDSFGSRVTGIISASFKVF